MVSLADNYLLSYRMINYVTITSVMNGTKIVQYNGGAIEAFSPYSISRPVYCVDWSTDPGNSTYSCKVTYNWAWHGFIQRHVRAIPLIGVTY